MQLANAELEMEPKVMFKVSFPLFSSYLLSLLHILLIN